MRTLLRECHLSATDFALYCGVKAQHVNNWFNRGVPVRRQEAIAALLSVNVCWLREGQGAKYPAKTVKAPPADPLIGEPVPLGNEVTSTAVRWARMTDEHMAGRIPRGAIVAFEHSLTAIGDKAICLFTLDGVQRVDYLYPQPDGGLSLHRHAEVDVSRNCNAAASGPQPVLDVCGRVLGWVVLDTLE